MKEDWKHAEKLVKIIELAMQERKALKKSVFGLAFVLDRGGAICRRCGMSEHWSRECPVGLLVKGGGRVG